MLRRTVLRGLASRLQAGGLCPLSAGGLGRGDARTGDTGPAAPSPSPQQCWEGAAHLDPDDRPAQRSAGQPLSLLSSLAATAQASYGSSTTRTPCSGKPDPVPTLSPCRRDQRALVDTPGPLSQAMTGRAFWGRGRFQPHPHDCAEHRPSPWCSECAPGAAIAVATASPRPPAQHGGPPATWRSVHRWSAVSQARSRRTVRHPHARHSPGASPTLPGSSSPTNTLPPPPCRP